MATSSPCGLWGGFLSANSPRPWRNPRRCRAAAGRPTLKAGSTSDVRQAVAHQKPAARDFVAELRVIAREGWGTMSEAALPATVGFIENAVRLRATHYREEAERFRSLADREPLAKMRRHLSRLAAQYEKLASDLELPVKEVVQRAFPDVDVDGSGNDRGDAVWRSEQTG
jgi:hypothetical protein